MSSKISKYIARCVHTNKSETYINLCAKSLDPFLEKIRSKEIYWNQESDNQENGFWMNTENIRFIQFTGIKGDKNENTPASMPCDGKICIQKDADSEVEKPTT